MKIVFSTDHIYLHGGIEKVLAEKANYFVEILNHEVFIVTSQQQNLPSCYPLNPDVKLIDLNINYDRSKSYFNISNLNKIASHFKKRRSALNKINPDFVIVTNYDFDFYWMPFIHKKSKKIKEFHSSQYLRQVSLNLFKKKVFNRINSFIENKYDALVLLNKDEQSFFKSKKTVVIPNPISIPNYQAKLDNKNVIAAGRIAPVKGFDRLLKIWQQVLLSHPDWELHIYGEDYLNTQLKLIDEAKELGIEKNVIFKGITPDMTKTMLNYSLYLMTSYTESFSMVIVEAKSVGLPTVAFDVPTGPKNLINNNLDGVLVKNNDLESYAAEVCNLIVDTNKRIKMGVEAKANSYNFANERIMREWELLFMKLKK